MPYSKEDFDRALNRILKYIFYRPRSVFETKRKLGQLFYAPPLIEDLIKYLSDSDFLNDALFARLWCESRISSKQFGPNKLKIELKQKGIDSLVIEETLEKIYADISQIELAHSFLVRKFKFHNSNLKQKYYTALFRQGFDSSVISEAIRLFLEETE